MALQASPNAAFCLRQIYSGPKSAKEVSTAKAAGPPHRFADNKFPEIVTTSRKITSSKFNAHCGAFAGKIFIDRRVGPM
jgi:hypothetical protein